MKPFAYATAYLSWRQHNWVYGHEVICDDGFRETGGLLCCSSSAWNFRQPDGDISEIHESSQSVQECACSLHKATILRRSPE